MMCLLTLFTSSADATTKEVSIKVNIFKDSNSAELSIETDSDVYTAIYNVKKKSFLDLDIGFTLSSPTSNSENYKIELMSSEHQCDSTSVDIKILFDGAELVDNSTDFMEFQYTNDDVRTSQHRFTLIYPELLQIDSMQTCSGILHVYASLDI
ncbi:MAG: hypothetical protein V5789_12325 [Colwellia sp.]